MILPLFILSAIQPSGTRFNGGPNFSDAFIASPPARQYPHICGRNTATTTRQRTSSLFGRAASFADDDSSLETPSETTKWISTRREWSRNLSATAAAAAVWGLRSLEASASGAAVLEAASTPSTSAVSNPSSLCDPSVTTWRHPRSGRVVHLIGTAHISSDSALLAGNVVREIKPSAVFVELDAKRLGRALPPPKAGDTDGVAEEVKGRFLADSSASSSSTSSSPSGERADALSPTAEPPRRISPFNVKERILRAGSAAVGNAIRGLYKKLESEGFNAGEEFIVAVREGIAAGSQIVLGDRDVEVTLQRLTQALAVTDLKALTNEDSEMERNMRSLMPSGSPPTTAENAFDKDQMTTFVETMKAKENVRLIMSNLKAAAPELYKAMVSERDEYMAAGLDSLDRFPTIVAVMGIAHIDGVEGNLSSRGWVPEPVTCLPPKEK